MVLPQLQHIPKFLDFSPDDDGFTCIFPSSRATFPRCGNPVNKKDRQSALLLRAEICALDPFRDDIEAHLESYAQLSCCVRYHREKVSDPPLLKQLCLQWKKQLQSAQTLKSEETVGSATTPADPLETAVEDVVDRPSRSLHRRATTPKNTERASLATKPDHADRHKVIKERTSQDPKDSPTSSSHDALSQQNYRKPNPRSQHTDNSPPNHRRYRENAVVPAEAPVRQIITRSQTGSLPWRFTPRQMPAEKTMLKRLTDPINEYSSKIGLIYLYTRASDPGFIKIGYTTRTTQIRFSEWEKSCGYKPILLYSTERVPHVVLLESLIKKDLSLQGRGRQETYCKHNKHCLTNHTEWFEISLPEAMQLVDTWVAWMCDASPYRCIARASGRNPPVAVLRDGWVQHFESLSLRKVEIRSRCLQLPVSTRPITVKFDQPSGVTESVGEEEEVEDSVSETRAQRRPLAQVSANTPRKADVVATRSSRTDDKALMRSSSSSSSKRLADKDSLDPKMAAAFALAASTLCKTFGVDEAALSTLLNAGSLADSKVRVGGTSTHSASLEAKTLPRIMAC